MIQQKTQCSDPNLYSLDNMKPLATKNQQITKMSRSTIIDKLIDTAADIIDSIWLNIKTSNSQPKVMSTASFIKEILKRSRATFSMLQLALFYLFRIKKSIYIYLQQDKEHGYKGYVCCGRRMFLAALMIASKYLNDRNYRNLTWAKIACLSVQEINKTEHIFLKLMNFELFVSKPLYDKWVCLLHQHIQKKDMICQHIEQNCYDNDSLLHSDYTNHASFTPPSHLSSPLSSCKSDTSSPDIVQTPNNSPPIPSLKRTFSFEQEDKFNKHIKLN